MEYQDHPLSALLPLMGQMETRELASDIQFNGLHAPITLLDGQILDGRNRYRACKLAGVEPKFRQFNGDGDPVAFIVSVNVKRRHLSTGQRAVVAAKLANMPKGDKSRFSEKDAKTPMFSQTAKLQTAEGKGKTVGQAAKELEVSPRSVETAKEVLKKASPEDVKAIELGEKKLATVAKEVKAKATAKEKRLDKTGYTIPDSILEDWQRAESFNDTIKQLHKIKLAVEKALEMGDLAFREITNSTTADLKNALSSLQRILPYAVCPTCQGHNRKKCTLCKQRGYISRFGYERWIPKETKQIREAGIK